MVSQLIIRLAPGGSTDDALEWALRHSPLRPLQVGRDHLADITPHASGARVVVLVPATDVLLTEARLPATGRQRMLKALPYALEDQLAADVDELHFAVGRRRAAPAGEGTPGAALPVAVVARARMDDWLAAFKAASIQPDAFIPETLALGANVDEWVLALDEREALLATGPEQGVALEPDQIDLLLELSVAEARNKSQAPERIRLYDCRAEARRAPLTAPVDVVAGTCPGGVLALLAERLDEQHTIDLLQGPYSRRQQLERLWRPWVPAAALLLVWVGLQGGLIAYDNARLAQESAMLSERIHAVFNEALPGQRVVDARRQMERALADVGQGAGSAGAGDFHLLIGGSAPLLSEAQGLKLNNLRYRPGQLEVDLEVADLQTLDGLKRGLGEHGWDVDIHSASARAGAVEGRLQIRRSGS
ncbi:hypothetical protein HUS23_03940 [Ectothiorhodospiraceae bacterium 2226]|nr:hypothetical protein HUS23_03940 [Ectothiorhodospiraceae bacterium 2226]